MLTLSMSALRGEADIRDPRFNFRKMTLRGISSLLPCATGWVVTDHPQFLHALANGAKRSQHCVGGPHASKTRPPIHLGSRRGAKRFPH